MIRLTVNADLCIGCTACSFVCPQDIIRIVRNDAIRVIEFFGPCPEDCDKCIQSCPSGALKLFPESKESDLPVKLEFKMQACNECGTYYATEAMIAYINSNWELNSSWLGLCPSCRAKKLSRLSSELKPFSFRNKIT